MNTNIDERILTLSAEFKIPATVLTIQYLDIYKAMSEALPPYMNDAEKYKRETQVMDTIEQQLYAGRK